MANHKKMRNPTPKLVLLEREELEIFERGLPRGISLAEAIRDLIHEKNEKASEKDFSPVRVWYDPSENNNTLCPNKISRSLREFFVHVRSYVHQEDELRIMSDPSKKLNNLITAKYVGAQTQRIKMERVRPYLGNGI